MRLLHSGNLLKGDYPTLADFPAATVDYDADSDSVDEFSSGSDGNPMDFLDFDADEQGTEAEPEAEGGAAEGEEEEEEEDFDDDDDDDDEPPVASTSAAGPTIEVAGMPSW